jgi:hypothetical protein
MPVTRSELLFLCGGALVGAAAAKNYSRIKEKIQPFVAGAGEVVGEAYTAAAKKVGERVEAMQDTMAEMRQNSQPEDAAAPSA